VQKPCVSIGRSNIFSLAVIISGAAFAQNASAWADQLKTQYKVVKLSADMNGGAVVQPGTVLAIQKTGIFGVPFANLAVCTARYQSGELHAPTGICPTMAKAFSRYFQVGEQIYPLKADVNVKKEQITFALVACDSCNNTDPPTYFKSQVTFELAKGFLETATFAQVQSEISQVFASPESNAGAAPAPSAAPATPPASAPAAESTPAPIAPPPPPPADQPPATVEIGQTTDQVVAALGQPQKIAKAGPKTIYFYNDLKITFTDGRSATFSKSQAHVTERPGTPARRRTCSRAVCTPQCSARPFVR
jgi:hypothetical protein